MPCNSDYLEPTHKEQQLKRAAVLLVYALEHLGHAVTPELRKQASHNYGLGPDRVPELCDLLTNLSHPDRLALLFAPNKTARDLANWWEDHQEADAKRLASEEHRKNNKKLVKKAKSKLSHEEYDALIKHIRHTNDI